MKSMNIISIIKIDFDEFEVRGATMDHRMSEFEFVGLRILREVQSMMIIDLDRIIIQLHESHSSIIRYIARVDTSRSAPTDDNLNTIMRCIVIDSI